MILVLVFGLDDSHNSYVTGQFEESTTFGDGETNETILSSAGSSDIFVAKYGVGARIENNH